MELYSKEDLIGKLRDVRARGWIANARPGNAGGVGNTLEDLLGITENNLPIPNAAEWELKCQRATTSSLTTLFHLEPSPRAAKLVVSMLLPLYGWAHETIPDEMSFRQTITGSFRSDRGFGVLVDHNARKVLISFDGKAVDKRHSTWLESVQDRIGLSEMAPQPYWGFDDLLHKAGTKLLNCFYIKADAMRKAGREYFWYRDIMILRKFDFNGFLTALEKGHLYVDFDARTGHNHGTKFRLRQGRFPDLYSETIAID